MIQTLVVIPIVAAALFFVARHLYRQFNGGGGADCGCGCPGCGDVQSCSQTAPDACPVDKAEKGL